MSGRPLAGKNTHGGCLPGSPTGGSRTGPLAWWGSRPPGAVTTHAGNHLYGAYACVWAHLSSQPRACVPSDNPQRKSLYHHTAIAIVVIIIIVVVIITVVVIIIIVVVIITVVVIIIVAVVAITIVAVVATAIVATVGATLRGRNRAGKRGEKATAQQLPLAIIADAFAGERLSPRLPLPEKFGCAHTTAPVCGRITLQRQSRGSTSRVGNPSAGLGGNPTP